MNQRPDVEKYQHAFNALKTVMRNIGFEIVLQGLIEVLPGEKEFEVLKSDLTTALEGFRARRENKDGA